MRTMTRICLLFFSLIYGWMMYLAATLADDSTMPPVVILVAFCFGLASLLLGAWAGMRD